jgi:hypothetical protein
VKPTINELRSLNQPILKHQWVLHFLKFPIAGAAFINPLRDMNLRCESTDIPNTDIKTQDVKIRQFKTVRPGVVDYSGEISMKMFISADGIILDFFSQWEQALMQPETMRGNNKNLVDAIVSIGLLDNKDKMIRTFTLFGAVLSSYKKDGLGTQNEILTATIGLKYDYFKEMPVDALGITQESIKTASSFLPEGSMEWLK